ncbi:26S proteasome regulatory subunit 6A [Desmophyllum pertusum]|uniref:26S proteasome regulatory subunit 6A n=1 Tax=Desmophyllum pertusum TaxID=174260 RepID=A0A9W9ZH32_9CNID|nr:26S proteasome regulatory subunit 6A [Desmophyllum pertusum]
MAALEDKAIWEDGEEMDEEVLRMQTDEIVSRARLLDNEIKIMKSEIMRINHEQQAMKEKIKLLDVDPQDNAEEDGANVDLDSQRKGKCAVIKTSTRQTYFLPVIGLVEPEI